MPRKKKDEVTEIEDVKVKKESAKTKTTSNKTTAKSESTSTKGTTKKATTSTTTKKNTTKKASTSTSKKASTKSSSKTTTTKKATTKEQTKKASSKTVKKDSKSTAKTTRTRKSSKSKDSSTNEPKIELLEYYDLPYRYNQTVVKVLYQAPTTLFIYWDISDDDRKSFVAQYGENFFNDTKPVLVIHNDTLHYSFEVEIDDFAKSWYLNIKDSNCTYTVELGRRPKYNNNEKLIEMPNDYLYVTHSNEIESPNDCVLFDKNMHTVYFKDVKTNIVTSESITSLSFLRNMGRIYNLYDLDANFNNNNYLKLDLNNPSSGNPSSTFK